MGRSQEINKPFVPETTESASVFVLYMYLYLHMYMYGIQHNVILVRNDLCLLQEEKNKKGRHRLILNLGYVV